jgi:hypothetical protein
MALSDGLTEEECSGRYGLAVLPSGKDLPPDQSLAEVEVWDGTRLLLVEREYVPREEISGVYLESETGARYALSGREVWIGRGIGGGEADGRANWIDLAREPGGTTVSHQHAVLSRDGQGWRLAVSAQARNPTYVNGEQVAARRSVALRHGDALQLGATRLRFREPAP